MKSSLGTASLRKGGETGGSRAALFLLIEFLGLEMNYGGWTEVACTCTSVVYMYTVLCKTRYKYMIESRRRSSREGGNDQLIITLSQPRFLASRASA